MTSQTRNRAREDFTPLREAIDHLKDEFCSSED
ncbi:hypothetical protein SAMN05428964_105114 [Thalassospira xiamenensis]|uniref:Uncharacterized protein n=1 Tax=Thalassospira xiamenensis TaxID=220697 RepID=A0A285TRW1_9PROT|nr:hypothetical protein SAMN05428964_105114 [Thalassospira xiamenensis]